MPSPKFSSLALTAVLCLTACAMPSSQTPAEHKQAAEAMRDPEKVYATVLQEATELQGKIVDGWFRGEDSRSLKSGYRDCSAATKARFACDYARMISDNKEDMVNNWKSYIPYSQRAEFARKWWSDKEHSTDFVRQNHWLQIIWLHEALMDGSELWWRALEKQFPGGIDSTAALAHDAEQDMVGKFKENESSPARSFSEMSP